MLFIKAVGRGWGNAAGMPYDRVIRRSACHQEKGEAIKNMCILSHCILGSPCWRTGKGAW